MICAGQTGHHRDDWRRDRDLWTIGCVCRWGFARSTAAGWSPTSTTRSRWPT